MYVYQEKAIERIKKGLRRMNGIVDLAMLTTLSKPATRMCSLSRSNRSA